MVIDTSAVLAILFKIELVDVDVEQAHAAR